jgi:hypothetical protein
MERILAAPNVWISSLERFGIDCHRVYPIMQLYILDLMGGLAPEA